MAGSAERVAEFPFASGLQIAASRQRPWLDDYLATTLRVWDEDHREHEDVPFDTILPDGSKLSERPHLYATARELAFWIRAGNYTRIDDAGRHKLYAESIVRLCYGLVARGFDCFSELTRDAVDEICADAAVGRHGVTTVCDRLQAFLQDFRNWDDLPPNLCSGKKFREAAICGMLNIPPQWSRPELKRIFRDAASRLNGEELPIEQPAKAVAVQNVMIYTTLFDAAYKLRGLLEAPSIDFEPFPEGPSKRADNLGSGTFPTPIPPHDLALDLIEAAIRHVAVHGETVRDEYQRVLKLPAASADFRRRSADIRSAIIRLTIACYIILAAFTARRRREILSLELECLAGNDNDGWWLNIYIYKTEQKRTWIPVPPIAARAVMTLRDLALATERADKALFRYFDPVQKQCVRHAPEKRLNDFANEVGAGSFARAAEVVPWHWTTRQFRRFFAVMFIYKYRGKRETLAHALRHYDQTSTAAYLRLDPKVDAIWIKEIWNFQVDIANDIAEGRAVYRGGYGDKLNKLRERLLRKFGERIKIIPERIAGLILKDLQRNQAVVRVLPHALCTCPETREAALKAQCRKGTKLDSGDVGPRVGRGGVRVCPGCPFALIGPEHLEHYDTESSLLEQSSEQYFVEPKSVFAELQTANAVHIRQFRGI